MSFTMSSQNSKTARYRLYSIAMASLLMSACTLLNSVASAPSVGVQSIWGLFKPHKSVDLVALQDSLLRFADDFINTEWRAINQLELNGSQIDRYDQVRFKLHFASDMVSLSTGSNPVGNLVNMVVYVSTLKNGIEEYWIPLNNGVSEQPILEALKGSEHDIWDIANHWLNPTQIQQLKAGIDHWKLTQPVEMRDFGSYGSISLVNDLVSEALIKNTSDNSLFAFLNLDPLASLDPATRELTQTRLFGERTLFVGKHMPQILEWQAELLSLRTLKHSTLTSLVDDAHHFSLTAMDLGRTLDQLPQNIARERKAIFDQIRQDAPQLQSLSLEFTRTFEEGQKMASSVTEVISGIKELRAMIQGDSTDNPVTLAKELSNLITQLDGTLDRINRLMHFIGHSEDMGKLEGLKDGVQRSTNELIDYAFKRILFVLTYLFFLMGLLVYLVFFLKAHFSRARS